MGALLSAHWENVFTSIRQTGFPPGGIVFHGSGSFPFLKRATWGDLPESYLGIKIIPAVEAILIEALEPRQNRKRGDDLSAVEYIQKEDPEIQKKKLKQSLEAALSRQ